MSKRPWFEHLLVSELNICRWTEDEDGYQRDVKSIAPKIAKNYDPEKFGALQVGKRSDGTFWVVDGQQRLTAAKLRKLRKVPCCVFDSRGPKHEAAIYSSVNNDKAKMAAIDTWRSDVVAEDPKVLAIEKVISEYGYTVVDAASSWKQIGCPNMLRSMHEYVGINGMKQIFEVLSKTWPETMGINGNAALGAMCLMLRKFSADFDGQIFIKRLSKKDLPTLVTIADRENAAFSKSAGYSRYKCLLLQFVKAYNRRTSDDQKLDYLKIG